jgi:hypothetical protein
MTTTRAERIAEVARNSLVRHAHHEAGHAVAAVARGGELVSVWLGEVSDWSDPGSNETTGGTRHQTDWLDQPFVTFAGVWAEATWNAANDPDLADTDFDEVLGFAWNDNSEGDAAKYDDRLAMLRAAAKSFGFGEFIGTIWEYGWADELTELWPAITEVAQCLINREPVKHESVADAVRRCLA